MTGADALVKILEIEGVRQVFCYPHTPVIEAMARGGLRVITSRQERVAGNMADGVSRSSNGVQIGTWTVQALAGSENAFAGIAHSFTDSTPVLFLPGFPDLSHAGNPPVFDSSLNYAATTKMAQKVLAPEYIPIKARQAFTALRSGRPQPVLLEMPKDVCDAEFKGELNYKAVPRIRAGADPGAVREAADRLLAARSPFIWAGSGVLYAEATPELVEVADLLGAPVMTTLQGKSAFPETHELSAGVAAYTATAMAVHHLKECDVLLAVGSSLSRAPFTPPIPDGKAIIHVTSDPLDLNKEYRAAVAAVADAKLFLAALAEELKGRVGEAQRALRKKSAESIDRLRREWLAEYEPLFGDDASPINGYRMFRELWAAIDPEETILTHESGACRDIQCVFYRSAGPRSYLGWGQSSQLGFSLGLAMGAKIANPGKLVVNVMGDGAVGMTGMDWETAVRENIPILTVVKHDSIFSGYDRSIPTASEKFRTNQPTGDYAGVAKALGCHAQRVTAPSELRPALEKAIRAVKGGQPAVVDVITAETRKLSKLI